MRYILGVDAGATKTTAQIVDETGKILTSVLGDSANMHTSNEKEFKDSIKKIVDEAIKKSEHKISIFFSVCFGISGLDTEMLWHEARRLILEVVKVQSPNNLLVFNDIKLVHPICSNKKYGISVIAGTGSNFYGVNEKGEEAYVGGLGSLLSDEGSSYQLGLKILRSAVRSADGRIAKTIFEELILKKFAIKNIRDLANIVYEENFGKTQIAELSKLANEAYIKNDKMAVILYEESAEDIATSINAVIEKLDMQKSKFDIVAIGGLFNAPFPYSEKIKTKLNSPNAEFIVCDKPPVEGAIKLALELINRK